MKKQILFITSTRIGDAVLSTGVLRHLLAQNDDCEVTIVCGPLCVSLFEGYPNLKEIIALKKEKYHGHWFKLWKKVIGTKWDMVVDLRDSAVSRLIFAKKRHIGGAQLDKKAHKVLQAAQALGINALQDTPSPQLWFTGAQMQKVDELKSKDNDAPILAIGPTANWIGKTWPKESFVELIKKLVFADAAPLKNHRIAILAAPGEEDDAQFVLSHFPADQTIDVIAKTTPGEAAAFLSSCDYYIGNDSGLMHCAAACGVKTFGLFGPSWPHLYSPWGEHTAFVATEKNFAELTDFEGYDAKTLDRSLMTDLSVDQVYDAFVKMV